MSASTNKRSFEFRMSKKVAELTQVVHMLFTRNHEKEVEIEALKDAYEHEIDLVIKDARAKLDKLEAKIKELQTQQEGDSAQQRGVAEHILREKEAEWRKQEAVLDAQLAEEKRECQNARDLLIQAQKDIENLRQGQSTEATKWTRDLDNKGKEVERLKMLVHTLEKKLKEAEAQSRGALSELERSYNKQQKELAQLKEEFQGAEQLRDQLIAKNRQLEADLRTAKRELSQRDSTQSGDKADYNPVASATFLDYAEEIEKLRREVARYRNELTNREGNFNRVFSEQKPVFVDRRAGRMAFGGAETPILRYNRERTQLSASLSGASIGPAIALSTSRATMAASEEDLREIMAVRTPVRSASSSSSRLPHLGMDIRTRAAPRLAKPKPLPREMLSAKAGGH